MDTYIVNSVVLPEQFPVEEEGRVAPAPLSSLHLQIVVILTQLFIVKAGV